MKKQYLICLVGVCSLFLISGTLQAQTGTSEDVSYTASNLENDNAQRISDLEEKVLVADALVKRSKKYEKNVKRNAREARAALKAEKQKAKKQMKEKAK
jgi:flagellar biosynthesis GTPase FlhF